MDKFDIEINIKVPEDKLAEAVKYLTLAQADFNEELNKFEEKRRFTPTFAAACEAKFQELAELFYEKNEQYGDKDPLANFRNGALLMRGNDDWPSMYEAAKGYAMKHVAHVFGKGQTISEDKLAESLGDIAVYCVIMQYMVEQWKKEKR